MQALGAAPAGPAIGPGQLVKDYRISRLLGQGGMGAVYEAVHQYIERKAAVKVLLPELSQNPQFATRFLNEARAVNLIRHPGLVEVFDFGLLPDGTAYIIMEYLEGDSLSKRLERMGHRLPQPVVMALGQQIALALAAAHGKQITHRDLKPDNVMIIQDMERPGRERVKILDFGIAKMAESGMKGGFKTSTGTTIGTPQYMAPEQCSGASDLGGKADVYALGVILYEMTAGRLPFDAELALDIMVKHLREPPPPLREAAPETSEPLAALVHRMLAKKPEERPEMMAVAEELEQMAGGSGSGVLVLPRPDSSQMARDPSMDAYLKTLAPGAEPATKSGAQDTGVMPPRKGLPKAALVAAGALLLVLAGGGYVLFSGSKPAAAPAPTTAAPAPPVPAAEKPSPSKAAPPPAAPAPKAVVAEEDKGGKKGAKKGRGATQRAGKKGPKEKVVQDATVVED